MLCIEKFRNFAGVKVAVSSEPLIMKNIPTLLLLFCCGIISAQCPDFTNLAGSGMTCQYGSFNDPFQFTGIASGRHTVITQQGGDPYTGYQLPMLPPGESAVVKLGNELVDAQAEAITYQFAVDPDYAILLIKYAVVFDNPEHPIPVQPHFVIRVLDANGFPLASCLDYEVFAWNSQGPISGYNSYGSVSFTPWKTIGVSLSDFAGQQVKLQFVTYDCAWHDHFGYAYFTASCISNKLSLADCSGSQITLSAPQGFASYIWNNGSTAATAVYDSQNGAALANCRITTDIGSEFLLSGTISSGGSLPAIEAVVYDTICEEESYNNYGFSLPIQNKTGTHLFRNTYFNSANCAEQGSTTSLLLTVTPHRYHIYDTACQGASYMRNGFHFNNIHEGNMVDSLVFNRSNGCDSVVVLHLTVLQNVTLSGTILGNTSVCRQTVNTYSMTDVNENLPLHWNVPNGVDLLDGQGTSIVHVSFSENSPDPAILTITGANECVSGTVSVSVSSYPSYHLLFQDTICSGNEYHKYGFDLARQDNAGWFIFNNNNLSVHGCDSMRTLQLLVTNTPLLTALAQPMEICSGQSTTIHALGDNSSFSVGSQTPPVAVGDILCTDGNIVKPSDWPMDGKSAMGIVFYVDNTGEHGWAVQLQDQSSSIQWGGGGTDIPTLTNYYSGREAIFDLNGYSNTQKIRNAGNGSTYPSAWAVDFENGWYVPAIGQLNLLFAELMTVNTSLQTAGGTPLTSNSYFWYWSSTEYDQTYAWKVTVDGNTHFDYKSGYNANNNMRAIRNF